METNLIMVKTTDKVEASSIVVLPNFSRMALVNILTVNDPQPCIHVHLYMIDSSTNVFVNDDIITDGIIVGKFQTDGIDNFIVDKNLCVVNLKDNLFKFNKVLATTDSYYRKYTHYINIEKNYTTIIDYYNKYLELPAIKFHMAQKEFVWVGGNNLAPYEIVLLNDGSVSIVHDRSLLINNKIHYFTNLSVEDFHYLKSKLTEKSVYAVVEFDGLELPTDDKPEIFLYHKESDALNHTGFSTNTPVEGKSHSIRKLEIK